MPVTLPERLGARLALAGWLTAAGLSVLIVAVTAVPYLLAYSPDPAGHVFTGTLFNPIDGQTYLAKMRSGWRGEWLFTLPYTAEPGAGVFLYTYFVFLGHVARWLGLSLPAVYHAARMLGALSLLLAAWAFVGLFFPSWRARLGAWLLFALGSGLGWLAVPFGGFTSDLWVAEAFPFLAVLANAHFAPAMALMLGLLAWTVPQWAALPARPRLALVALAATALGLLFPLALLPVGLAAGAAFAWRLAHRQPVARADWAALAVLAVFALPWLAQAAWLSLRHPVLSAWSAQNVTPSPPWWDALLSGGVVLALAVWGAALAFRNRGAREEALALWLVAGVLAVYAPFALQRRLSIGLWMPLALLAMLALRAGLWPRLRRARRPLVIAALALAVLPSNVLVYAATLGAVAARDPAVFWTAGEAEALAWLDDHDQARPLVLASPDLGLYIPAHTDARVLYGHPFETVNAGEQRQAVEDFYAGRVPAQAFIDEHDAAYVLVGPRERALMNGAALPDWPVAFENAEVVIYAP